MYISRKKEGGVLTISTLGKIDALTTPDFEFQARHCIESSENTDVVFDFAEVTYIASMGLRALLSFQKTMNEKGSMKLVNVQKDVMEVFKMTGFDKVLNIQ